MFISNTKRIAISGLMLALGIILPFATSHAFGIPGTVFLPMHIPVLLCGFFCGAKLGALCGLILPVKSGMWTDMPTLFPLGVIMTFELCAYGFISGYLYKKSRYSKKFIYPILLVTMASGRIVSGILYNAFLLANINLGKFSIGANLIYGIPGAILQIVIIPPIVIAISKSIKNERSAKDDAIELVKSREKDCVVVRNNTIISAENTRGIRHIITLYENDSLKDSFVADVIIGKAAAMIFSLAGVKSCYGKVVSKAGYEWLSCRNIPCEYETLTDAIQNRNGDGICPMENTVKDISDEKEAVVLLKKKVEELSKKESLSQST